MPDDSKDQTGRGVFDDDRLLAYALGLDDDAELEEAAAADDGLRRRLDAMRADVAAIGEGVARAVPEPDEDYTDLADARWAGLGEYLRPPAPKPARRRGSRWLRVLAPVAAVAVAVAVGVAVIGHQNGSSRSSSSGSAASEAGKSALTQPQATAPVPSFGTGSTAGGATRVAPDLAAQSRKYAVVVVARAKAVRDHVQTFRVVKRLKGASPRVVTLKVMSAPARVGALHVLFLEPLATPVPWPTAVPSASPMPTPVGSETPGPLASALPTPGPATTPRPSATPTPTPTPEPMLDFSYQGQAAVAQQLPAGMDAASVQLP